MNKFFNQTINILTATSTVNDLGDYVSTYTTAATVTGLIDLITGGKETVGAQYIQRATHVMFAKHGTSINDQAKVISGGKTYRVLYVDNPVNRNHHLEVILEHVGVDDL